MINEGATHIVVYGGTDCAFVRSIPIHNLIIITGIIKFENVQVSQICSITQCIYDIDSIILFSKWPEKYGIRSIWLGKLSE